MLAIGTNWNSIFGKLAVSFLLVILPVSIVSLLMNESGRTLVSDTITESAAANVRFYGNQLDIEFDKIIDFGREYLFDDDLGKLSIASSTLTDIERTRTIMRAQRSMAMLKSSSSYISTASVLIPGIQRRLDSEYRLHTLEAADGADYPLKQGPIVPRMIDNRLVIEYAYPDTAIPALYKDRELMFLIEVEIDQRRIAQVLQSFTADLGGGAILTDRNGGWSISGGAGDAVNDAALAVVGHRDAPPDAGLEVSRFTADGERYMATMRFSPVLDAYLLVYIPESALIGPLQTYWSWYWWLLALSLLAILFFSSVIYRLIHRPLVRLVRAFHAVESGNFNNSLKYSFRDEFAYLYRRYNEMLANLKQLIDEVYEQRIRAQMAEYRQLQSQINPHFLYNSFFTMSQMAKARQHDNVMRFTRYLGHYLQFVTRDGAREVPLAAETDFARTYTEIQQFRFARRIEVQFGELPEEVAGLAVPRIILQPLIENAYHHGLGNKMKNGLIRVRFRQADGWLAVIVEDNGEELDDDTLYALDERLVADLPGDESTGIVNVHRRVRIRFGEAAGIAVSRSELGGLRVELKIPVTGGNALEPLADC